MSNRPLYWLVLAELNVNTEENSLKKGTKAATGTIPFQKVHISTYWDTTPVTAFAPFFLSIEEKDKHILDKSSLNIIKVHIWIITLHTNIANFTTDQKNKNDIFVSKIKWKVYCTVCVSATYLLHKHFKKIHEGILNFYTFWTYCIDNNTCIKITAEQRDISHARQYQSCNLTVWMTGEKEK